MTVGGDCKNGVLNVFIFVDLRLVEGLVEVRRALILVRDSGPDELGHWKENTQWVFMKM